MDILHGLKQIFSRAPQSDPKRLARFMRSRQGVKLTAQLMQQTDNLAKKDVAAWRTAWQQAIDYENPNQARFFGNSLIQLNEVEKDGDGLRFSSVELVPRKHVCPEYGVVTPEPAADRRTGIGYREGDLSLWCIEVGKPRDLGLLLKCAPACISKKNMLAFWDMFGEVFGAPMRVARTNTTDENEKAKIERAFENMGAAFWALLPDGTDIEIKESSRSDVYDKRIDRANSELSKGVLMQTMTIDSGSSLSQSETHLEIFEDVVAADTSYSRSWPGTASP